MCSKKKKKSVPWLDNKNILTRKFIFVLSLGFGCKLLGCLLFSHQRIWFFLRHHLLHLLSFLYIVLQILKDKNIWSKKTADLNYFVSFCLMLSLADLERNFHFGFKSHWKRILGLMNVFFFLTMIIISCQVYVFLELFSPESRNVKFWICTRRMMNETEEYINWHIPCLSLRKNNLFLARCRFPSRVFLITIITIV